MSWEVRVLRRLVCWIWRLKMKLSGMASRTRRMRVAESPYLKRSWLVVLGSRPRK